MSGGRQGEGLHERKPHQPQVGVPQHDENRDQDDSSDESGKDKKTFGRTPDGTGTTLLHSSTTVFVVYPLSLHPQRNSGERPMSKADWPL